MKTLRLIEKPNNTCLYNKDNVSFTFKGTTRTSNHKRVSRVIRAALYHTPVSLYGSQSSINSNSLKSTLESASDLCSTKWGNGEGFELESQE